MAAQTLRAKLPIVFVLMTRRAFLLQAQKRMVQVFNFDLRFGRGRNLRRRVTPVALQLLVLPFQRKAGQGFVIEAVPVKLGDGKLPSVVFQMAARAIGFGGGNIVGPRVIADIAFHPPADFRMAIQALKAAIPQTEVVACGAFGGPFQICVRTRQWSGRNLRVGRTRSRNPNQICPDQKSQRSL